MKRIFKL